MVLNVTDRAQHKRSACLENKKQVICGNKMPTSCNRGFFADLIACSTCFGHHYAHHKEIKSIIQWLLRVVFCAVFFFQVAVLVWI